MLSIGAMNPYRTVQFKASETAKQEAARITAGEVPDHLKAQGRRDGGQATTSAGSDKRPVQSSASGAGSAGDTGEESR